MFKVCLSVSAIWVLTYLLFHNNGITPTVSQTTLSSGRKPDSWKSDNDGSTTSEPLATTTNATNIQGNE